jgi:DNA processing protein
MSVPIDYVALSLLPVWRWRLVAERLREGQTPSDVLLQQCADGVRKGRAPAWSSPDWARDQANVLLARAAAAGILPLLQPDAAYPSQLLQIVDPPPVLWLAGQATVLRGPAVAIVGSRAGTSYALSVAERLSADLAANGVCVVSGLARGVDSAAHRGALMARGATVGVLGCGVDVAYPPENASLIAEVRTAGAVVSELPPGTGPRPGFFPRRNRIISGLVRAVVIVEAGEKSGSLITARCALEQGRDVLAVPGNVLTGRNKGGHALLRDGARVVETAQDIIEELCLPTRSPDSATPARPDDVVLAAMNAGESSDLGEISARTRLPVAQLLPRLLELELQGAVRREPGGRFLRCQRNVLG